MTTNMTKYEGVFVNTETNSANENIQQPIAVRLYDTETVVDNPYNVRFVVTPNGDGTQTIMIVSDPFPDIITAAAFGYNNGSWQDTPINLTGRTSIIIPEGDWTYSFVVTSDLGDTRRLFSSAEEFELEMAEIPLVTSVIDNDEDKFTPIRSKQAEIQIYSSDEVDISDFAEGGDNRWYVEIETQTEGIIFKGYLSISDLQQEFLPDPNLIILTATDGIGFLDGEPLTNFEGLNPVGEFRIIDFLVWALAKTGLMLDVKVCMNIRETTAVPLVSDEDGSGHMYDFIFLNAKTFEEEIGLSEDCYTVLEKILSQMCFITQYKGKWVIMRVDEMETSHEYYFTTFDYEGNFVSNSYETFIKNIGIDYTMSFMNDDAVVALVRPNKEVNLTYKYEYPEEIICNEDFERGDFIEDLPDETNADGVDEQVKAYDFECWKSLSKEGGQPNTLTYYDQPQIAGADLYIKKYYYDDTEVNRKLFIKVPAGTGNGVPYLKSQSFPVHLKDKISFSLNLDYGNTGGGTSFVNSPVMIGLFADSGNIYWWEAYDSSDPDAEQAWTLTPFGNVIPQWYLGATIDKEWSFSFTSPPIPESGVIYVYLLNQYGDEIEANFSPPNVEIISFINGSYQRYSGQQHIVENDNINTKAKRKDDVFISDAPRIAMKGALLKEGSGTTIFSGIVSFGDVGQFEISGNETATFEIGQRISITGSADNNITTTITGINYSIIGDITQIFTDATTVEELSVSVTITVASFVLAGLFYNAALNTSGPGDVFPFGQIQAFDVWNQYNRVMRTFEGTIDRTDSTLQLPDLLHKYILRDISNNTTNGTNYRVFQLLHYEMDLHLCEWQAFFHEVFNTAIEKTYEGHSFKYITK